MHAPVAFADIAPPRAMRWVVAGVALATIAAIIALWALAAPRTLTQPLRPRIVQRVVPPTVIPPVEPIEYADVAPEKAVEINAAIPFSTDPNPAARPFILRLPELDRARATDCLAAAMLYEAGSGDPQGQRAVAQVIINRMRHPAFPKTICGVVFQGQERRTGCQFTFTCDGALIRRPPAEAWEAARARAAAILDGDVFKAVGHSTHYHTDWVVPYWSSSLDKVVAVRTHLFFRWTGWWGTPRAFRGGHASPEPLVKKIAFLSEVHGDGTDPELLIDPVELGALSLTPVLQDNAGTFAMLFDKSFSPNDFPALAAATCGDRPFCKLFAWSDKTRLPKALPVPEAQVATMSYSYLRDRARGFDKSLWNCAENRRADPAQCMKQRILLPVSRVQLDSFKLEALPKASTTPVPRTEPATPPPVGPPPVRRTVSDPVGR